MRIPHGCRAADGPAWTRTRDRLAGESGGSKLSSGLSVAKRADEPTCLGAVEHDGRRLAVAEGAELDERGLSGDAYVRAMPVGAEDKRWAELRGERGEGAAGLRTFIECARVVAEEDVDLAAAGDALKGSPLERGRPVPAASGSRRPDAKRAAVRETAQATETEARSGRQVVQAEAERHRARRGSAGVGAGERLGVVVVPLHEQKLEACSAEQGTGGAEKAAPFRLARQVAEVAERDEPVAALLDRAIDQAAQVASVAVQVTKDKQTAHSSRAYRARSCSRTGANGREPLLALPCRGSWVRVPSSASRKPCVAGLFCCRS
jgi:hypothetical protein